jgi:hypothetical protein
MAIQFGIRPSVQKAIICIANFEILNYNNFKLNLTKSNSQNSHKNKLV